MKSPSTNHNSVAAQAQHLRETRAVETPFHTYPGSSTVRSLAFAMIDDLHKILDCVPEDVDVPPWNIMLMAQAANNVNAIKRFVAYYSQSNHRHTRKLKQKRIFKVSRKRS